MNEEVLKVLEMVKSGRISTEEGEKLLSAIGTPEGGESKKGTPSGKRATMLRVRVDVDDPEKTDQAKVTINVPLSLAKKLTGLVKLIPKEAKAELDEKGIDIDAINLPELIELFEAGELDEELVNIDATDGGKGAKVRIYVD